MVIMVIVVTEPQFGKRECEGWASEDGGRVAAGSRTNPEAAFPESPN